MKPKQVKSIPWTKIALTISTALICAIALYGLSYATRDLTRFGDLADQAVDRALALSADSDEIPLGPRIVVIDFNDRTLSKLGNPPLIPPSSLALAIEQTVEMQPRAVMIDIDLSWISEADDVERLNNALESSERAGVVLLLSRVRYPNAVDGRRDVFPPTAFDSAVRESATANWVSAEAIQSGDGIVRSIAPFVEGYANGQLVRVPAPHLILALKGDEADLAGARARFGAGADEKVFLAGAQKIDLSQRENSIVRFTDSWPPKSGHRISVLPATPLIEQSGPIDDSLIKDSIVVIGSSGSLQGDMHETPLGPMPGAFIIANAIGSWQAGGPQVGWSFLLGGLIVLAGALAVSAMVSLSMVICPTRFRDKLKNFLPGTAVTLIWITAQFTGVAVDIGWLMILAYPVAWIAVAAFGRAKQSEA